MIKKFLRQYQLHSNYNHQFPSDIQTQVNNTQSCNWKWQKQKGVTLQLSRKRNSKLINRYKNTQYTI